MRAGIVGLPLSGKSTLFRVLTGAAPGASAGRREVRVGVARVPDPRLDTLARMYERRRKVPATVEYVDVPGVARGQGASLVDLPALRGLDALVHVVRGFPSDLVPHPEGSVDPARDAGLLDLEMLLADLALVEGRLGRLDSQIAKAHRPEDAAERELFRELKAALEASLPLRELPLSAERRAHLRSYALLSEKPVLLVLNVGEEQLRGAAQLAEQTGLARIAARPGFGLCAVSASIEAEISQLEPGDARAFLEDLGLSEPGLDRVIRESYALLGLISFFTVGDEECRAWTVPRGTRALQAAGAVHSDMERGFIRAEVVAFDDLKNAGSTAACRERGTLRLEGKDYVVRDGDVIHFRFAV